MWNQWLRVDWWVDNFYVIATVVGSVVAVVWVIGQKRRARS
ncbi:EYxxD motif small membrane protein [Desmospora activa]|uniref:Uncharacterized protein n=1 Tax=Desmospora activa DSM 45169 TaxID=1121389 RepID=A0A2T4Z6H2_9BACL|nr:EYxxD motif small membrane protein [Desmospora activa]PTM57481.1 hypothetical protein C8J48_0029 [Desmospora activa DSM 45169]